jgi:3-isopropylmalate/(R)-2-methylmalate dehydratase small subunit
MKPIQTITGQAASLARANIDTDQIIPARFMNRSRAEGYGDQCFYDLRFFEDGSPREDWLIPNSSERPTILLAHENFGCGSSREAAVYALMDFGIQVMIAPSFGDIFRSNAGKNGLLTVALPRELVNEIMDALRTMPEMAVTIDLPAQRLRAGDLVVGFEIDALLKNRLERGLDELSVTLELEKCIASFEAEHLRPSTWRIPVKNAARQE